MHCPSLWLRVCRSCPRHTGTPETWQNRDVACSCPSPTLTPRLPRLKEVLTDGALRTRLAARVVSPGPTCRGRRSVAAPLACSQRSCDVDVQPTFAHLDRLVDDRGIWQHAVGTSPDPAHGYCLDDAARAAIVMSRLVPCDRRWHRPLATCCRFIGAALDRGGGARNFMDADGTWLDVPHRGDHVGRAIWSLGVLSAESAEPRATWATELVRDAMADQLQQGDISLHTQSYALLGVAACRDTDVVREFGTAALDDACNRLSATHAWPWPEQSVRYDAGRIPEAMISAGHRLDHRAAVEAGLRLLDWLTVLVAPPGRPHRYPGCHGLVRGAVLAESGDEQPLEAAAFAAAHAAAVRATGSPVSARTGQPGVGMVPRRQHPVPPARRRSDCCVSRWAGAGVAERQLWRRVDDRIRGDVAPRTGCLSARDDCRPRPGASGLRHPSGHVVDHRRIPARYARVSTAISTTCPAPSRLTSAVS